MPNPATTKKRIDEAVAAGVCLIGDCLDGADCRGLCRRHYNRFVYRKKRMTDAEFAAFEASAISHGLILPAGVIAQAKQDEFTKAETHD